MRDQARFKEEMDKRKSMEDELRKQAEQAQQDGQVVPEGDLAQQVDRLQKIEQRQKQEIDRYTRKLLINLSFDKIINVQTYKRVGQN